MRAAAWAGRRRIRRQAATALLVAIAALWGCFGTGIAQAAPTAAPTLISPASSSYTSSRLTITYVLPEATSSEGVGITFLGEHGFKAVIKLTSAESYEAGEHTVVFDTEDLDATSEIENQTAGTSELPDGTYKIALYYKNDSGGGNSTAEATDVHIVTATAAPSLTAPADGSEANGPFTVEYTLPEEAAAGSVTLQLEGESSGLSVLALRNAQSGAHAITINPANPLEQAGIASGPLRLPSDKYKLTLTYQDFLHNPSASSSTVELTLERKCGAGYYSTSYGEAPCLLAEAGHYVPGVGATEETACAAGTYSSVLGASACPPSPAGFYAPAGSATAIPCTPGTHNPHTNGTSAAACEADPPGSYSPSGSAVAILCEAGRFAAGWGNHECTPAEPGHFVQDRGANSQLPCPAGSYSSVAGAESCELAPVNTYALEGAIEPTPCPTGTEASSEGQSACTPIASSSGAGGDSGGDTPTLQIAPPSTTAPSIADLRINERRFRQGAIAARSGHGPVVSYRLSATATLRYTLYRSSMPHPPAGCQGKGAKCRAIAGWSTGALAAGAHTASLASILRQGKSSRARSASQPRLAPGRYVLTVQILGAQGARSQQASVSFAVL